jgi:transcriptional regulator with XRE-family HTH domain
VGANRSQVALQFGKNLRLRRQSAGFSQEGLGVRAAVGRNQVGKLERGVHEPQLETILKLADALSIPLGDLLRGMYWMPACRGRFEFQSPAEQHRATTDCASEWKRDVATVERLVFEEAITLHPQVLTVGGHCRAVDADPNIEGEIETVAQAIRHLKQIKLVQRRADEAVRPTSVALHIGSLLMGCTCKPGNCQC